MPITHYCPDQNAKPGVSDVLGAKQTALCNQDIHADHRTTSFDLVSCSHCLRVIARVSDSASKLATADAYDYITRPEPQLVQRAESAVDGALSHAALDLLRRTTPEGKARLLDLWRRTYSVFFKERSKPTIAAAARVRLRSLVNDENIKVPLLRQAVLDLVQLLDSDGITALASHLADRSY